jgi:hypothetical protein
MTADRLTECLRILGWENAELARRLSMTRPRTVRDWVNGNREIPDRIAEWIEAFVQHVQQGPEPPKAG